jgi:hypothetical protein
MLELLELKRLWFVEMRSLLVLAPLLEQSVWLLLLVLAELLSE